jgi:hypothetical protein
MHSPYPLSPPKQNKAENTSQTKVAINRKAKKQTTVKAVEKVLNSNQKEEKRGKKKESSYLFSISFQIHLTTPSGRPSKLP